MYSTLISSGKKGKCQIARILARAFANKHQSLAEEIINMSFFFYVDANVGVMTLAIERVHFCLQRKIWIDCLKRSEYRVYGRPSRRGILVTPG